MPEGDPARAIRQDEPRRLPRLQLPHRAGEAQSGGVHGELGARPVEPVRADRSRPIGHIVPK